MGSVLLETVVLVRTHSAGVHFGVLASKDGTNVLLANARRIWSWVGAFTLSEIATTGVAKGSRISCSVPLIELTEAIELIPISDAALAKLEAIHE